MCEINEHHSEAFHTSEVLKYTKLDMMLVRSHIWVANYRVCHRLSILVCHQDDQSLKVCLYCKVITQSKTFL
jgi:hypothetical protein